MKKYLSVKKIIAFVIIVGIGYSIYSYYFSSPAKTVTVTKEYTVSTGSIENSIKVTGKASLVNEQKLKFNQVGKVEKVYFKDGSKVKQGQLIAELEKTDINSTIKQAELSLSDAQIKLQDLLNGAQYKDILNGENNVTTSENKIQTLENDLSSLIDDKENKIKDYANQISQSENDIKNKEASLLNTKNDLATLEKIEEKGLTDYDIDLRKTISDSYTNAKKQLIDLENSLFKADEILGISNLNKDKNDSFEVYLGAKNSSTKVQAERDWSNSNTLLLSAQTYYDSLNSNEQSSTEIIDFLDKLSESYFKLMDLGKSGQEMMNASIVSSNLSQNDIDNKSAVFGSILTSAQSTYSSVKSTIANIQKLTDPELKKAQSLNTINSKKQSIADLEYNISKLKNDLEKAKSDFEYTLKNYESQIKQKNLDIESAKNSLEYSKESLKVVKQGATSVELSQARNNVAKSKLSLENARKGLDKYELTAPFDGTVRKIDFKVGDNLTADEQKYIYIENPNLVEISTILDQLDIVKVSLNQKAKVVFDSYPDKEFIGSISEKDTTPAETSGVTSYTITIALDKGDAEIYSSMTAKVSIIVESKKDILIIPSSYIETAAGIKYVIVKENGSEIKKEVATGITDDSNIEITEGLNKGDVIIKKITSTVKAGTSSLLPTGGAGGAGRTGGGGNSGGTGRTGGGGNFGG
ncbi:MAG: efflux RND transporter periplasmic adaptor subunit [Candidatus Gracilibacteria bacterium]|nr:efflux RND transporter periplasmic adaptor subunit [Candidatus Gracilibacteria bacterium]